MSRVASLLPRLSLLATTLAFAVTACGPIVDESGDGAPPVASAALSATPAKVDLRVFAVGDLPNEGWFILQTVDGKKPLLPPTDREQRGDVTWFRQSPDKPIYTASAQLADAAKFNVSFMQIENTDARLVDHVVLCRQYKHLQPAIADYLAKHPGVTELAIDANVATQFIEGSRETYDKKMVMDNSTCTVEYTINGEDVAK